MGWQGLDRLKKYKKMLRNMDKQKWIVCIMIGILLLVIALPVESGTGEKRVGDEEQNQEGKMTTGQYERQMEQRLEEIIGQMDGVGMVDVMITLEDEGERVVAQDVNRRTDTTEQQEEVRRETSTEESTVFSGEVPYETKVKVPEIRGICIVAQGAENSETKVKIYEAVQALFSIEAHKISIVEMGAQEGT